VIQGSSLGGGLIDQCKKGFRGEWAFGSGDVLGECFGVEV
jgi:hypothetical protein